MSAIKLNGLWTLLAVLGTASCAPLPDPDSSFEPKLAIPASATVAVISKGVDQDLKARFNRDSTDSGTKTGAVTGSAAGFAAAGFCGPFFFLCALGTVPAGMIVGAAGGAAAGAVEDVQKKPGQEDLERLEALLASVAERRTLHEEVRAATAVKVPADRRAPGKDADALLEVSIGDIRFQQRDDGKYRWMLRVNLTAQWNRNRGRVRAGTLHYRVYSETLPLEEWMNDGGSAIEGALDDLAAYASKRIERDFFDQ